MWLCKTAQDEGFTGKHNAKAKAKPNRKRSRGGSKKQKKQAPSCAGKRANTACTGEHCVVVKAGGGSRPIRLCTHAYKGCGCWALYHDPETVITGLDM